MSEKAPIQKSPEQQNTVEASVESKQNLERLQKAAESAAETDNLHSQIESLQSTAENQAISGEDVSIAETTGESGTTSFGIDASLKANAYNRTLRKVRTNLKAPDRIFSYVVHNRVIESVSNVGAKTIARPSAFLGGSFAALLGSAILLYMSRQYGFTYNYTVFIVLFTGGFFLGLILELLLKLVSRNKHSSE